MLVRGLSQVLEAPDVQAPYHGNDSPSNLRFALSPAPPPGNLWRARALLACSATVSPFCYKVGGQASREVSGAENGVPKPSA